MLHTESCEVDADIEAQSGGVFSVNESSCNIFKESTRILHFFLNI